MERNTIGKSNITICEIVYFGCLRSAKFGAKCGIGHVRRNVMNTVS